MIFGCPERKKADLSREKEEGRMAPAAPILTVIVTERSDIFQFNMDEQIDGMTTD